MEAPASKKRKLKIPCHGHVDVVDDDDEDVNEEEKIEKFFALIKNIREARERLITNGSVTHAIRKPEMDVNNKKRKLEVEINEQVYAWKPSFQREDFMEEADHHKSRLNPPSATAVPLGESSSQRKEVRASTDEIKESLDLRLSL